MNEYNWYVKTNTKKIDNDEFECTKCGCLVSACDECGHSFEDTETIFCSSFDEEHICEKCQKKFENGAA